VLLGDPVDHLLDEHGLAHTGAAEQPDLATLHIGLQKVDDLDAGLEHLPPRLERVELRSRAVYLPPGIGLAHFAGVQPLTDHVEDVTEHGIADGNRDTATRVDDRRSAGEPVGRLQTDATRPALADLLGNLRCDENLVAVDDELDLDGSVDLGQRVRRELDVDDRACDRDDAAVLELLGLRDVGGNGGHTFCSSVACG
jgi:hypothetical protein